MSSTGDDKAKKMAAARDALKAKFGKAGQTGGKGTQRRKVKGAHKPTAMDDKKLQGHLKRLGVNTIPNIEEVNMFLDNGKVVHFKEPKVQASLQSNTYVVSGSNDVKSLEELLPDIISQLGTDNLMHLKKIAESMEQNAKAKGAAEVEDDDDIPELDGDFEEVSKQD